MPHPLAAAARAERQLRALYFCYFGYVGTLSPYLSLYFEAGGYSVAQIGLLLAVPQALRIFAPPVWGLLADRGGRAGRLLVTGALLTTLFVALLPWATAQGQATTLALLALLFFASAGIGPIAESSALALAGGDAGRYGAMRLWGSVGFVVTVVLVGPALDLTGVRALPWFLAAIAAGIALVGLRLATPAGPPRTVPAVRLRARLRERPVAAFFAANFLMLFAHAALYVLFSLYLQRHGYSRSAIGLFWAVSVIAEIALFRWQAVLFDRFSAAGLFAFSIGVAALRFAIVGVSSGGLVLLLLTQLLHAITFGLHHSASMALLHRWFEPAQQARAQALFVTIGYGCGGTLGGLAMSSVWENVSPEAAFTGASLAAAAGCLIALACRGPAGRPDEAEETRR
ncbi:MAG: MFS transporter [Burkholderiaceae bacterium]|nr:MFS transporter [Burkholderiaceae bacterium]